MTKSLLQLTWWKIVNIRQFFCYEKNVRFVTVNNTVVVLQIYKVYISLYICCLIFLYPYCLGWYIPNELFQTFVLARSNNWYNWKSFSKALLVFKMYQWFGIIFSYWNLRGYVSLSVVTFGLSVLFLVLANLFHVDV